nr:ATP-dependent (S)-NAD(P)H-hydrate dehydratase [Tanacetum cinerariifolium]
MGDNIQEWYIRPEEEAFDLSVYDTYTDYFSIELHYAGRFTDSPNKKYVDGEFACVDMVENTQFRIDVLNIVLCSLGFEHDDEINLYYKIPLKSLDIGLIPLVSENDTSSFLGYVHKHKMMYVYVKLVETTEGSSDEDGEGGSENDSEDGHSDVNDIIDKEHLVDEVEVNMKDDLEVLDYDSLESDQEDVSENARSRGLRKLKKAASSSGIINNFYVGKEFINRDLAKERIIDYSVETKRNIDFKRNDKRRIREIFKCVMPSMTSKTVFLDKDEGLKEDIFRNGKAINEDTEEDKKCCPWVLYFTKGDKAKWVVKTYKDEHKYLQSKKIKHCTSTFLAKHITDLLIMDPKIPVKAIQEQMQKKFHVVISKTKAFREKTKAQVHLKGGVTVQYSLLRDYLSELQICNLNTTVKIDVYRKKDPEKTTRMFRIIYVCLDALKRGFKEEPPISHSSQTGKRLFPSAEHRKWEISGIPCKHVIAAIHDMADNGMDVGKLEDWVHDSYKLKTWMNVYSHKNAFELCHVCHLIDSGILMEVFTDYVPGPKEPEQTSLSPDYVPKPEYPEYLAPSNEDPEEDPADGGDDDDDDSFDDDDDDDAEEKQEAYEDDDDEEEEHLASADYFVDLVPSVEDTEAFETDESAPTPVPSPRRRTDRISIRPQIPMSAATEALIVAVADALPSSPPPFPLTPLSSLLPQIPLPPLLVSSPSLPLPSPPTVTSPTYDEAPLGYKAAKIRLRAASPPTHHPSEIPSPPLLLPSTSYRDDLPEAYMSLWKRARFTTPTNATPGRPMSKEVGYRIEDVWDDMVGDIEERAPTTIEGLSQRVTDLPTTLAWDTHEIYVRLKDAQDDRALQRARVITLFKDIQYHLHTDVLMESEARCARQARGQAMDCNRATLEPREPVRTDDPEDAGSSCGSTQEKIWTNRLRTAAKSTSRCLTTNMQSFSMSGLEVDAVSVLRSIAPALDPNKHKGQAGKIAVVGGCREYTGAPYFSAISALKIGADLSHVICSKDAAPVIKTYSPELIVHPLLEESYNVRDEDKQSISTRVLAEVDKWLERFDCLVIGPGLGRDPFLLVCHFFFIFTFYSRKIAVVGGCREYTGAPYFSAISALKIGADLSHVICSKDAAPVIKTYSPELIVHPLLEESYNVRDEDKQSISTRVLAEVDKWLERFDCLVIGPGLGRDPFLLDCVSEIMKHARRSNVPMVIDGDGLFLVTNCLDLQLLSLANSIGGVTILRKGQTDYISDGKEVKSVSIYGSPRRCGGQGDILSGSVAVFLAWARRLASKGEHNINPAMLGCIAGSALMRKAASVAFEDKKRSTLTTDIIECLGRSLEDICPVH